MQTWAEPTYAKNRGLTGDRLADCLWHKGIVGNTVIRRLT